MIWRAFICCALALAPPQYASAQEQCRLALLLAVDVSSSVSEDEYNLQRSGLAAALMDADVQSAILDSRDGHVAFALFEWSGRYQQKLVVDWTLLDSRAAIDRTATAILTNERSYARYPTSMGYSLGYGAGLFQTAPDCDRQVMDVSGDGINNDGIDPRMAYRQFPFQGVTINGLVIKGDDPNVQWYYESEVLLGAHAFLEVADGFESFERAMTRKLFREISALMIGEVADRAATPPKS